MRVGGEALDLLRRLKTHVIIAMRRLRLAAGIDAIDLARELIAGPEPRLRNHRQRFVGIIGREGGGLAQREFFERVPDAIVGPGLGEMVAARLVVAVLLRDDVEKHARHGVDRDGVWKGAAQYDDSRAVLHHRRPFGHQLAALAGDRGRGADLGAIVDRDMATISRRVDNRPAWSRD